MKKRRIKPKIFHGLVNYGTQSGLFARELRKFGYDAISVTYSDAFKRVTDVELKHGGTFLQKILKHSWNYLFLFKCFFKYDIFHFYYGTTLLPSQFDLKFYRLFNKKVVFHYLGGDVERYDGELTHYGNDAKKVNKRVLCRLAYETPFSSCQLVCAPYYSPFVQNSKVLPLIVDIKDFDPIDIPKERPLRFLHAPTNKRFKGSDYISSAFNKLEEEGFLFEYKEVTGITHLQLQEEYKKCDVFIDQIIAGWYGTASIEAMSYGKPTIAYINENYFAYINYGSNIPIISATKDDVYYKIKTVLEMNRGELDEIGRKSQYFVFKYHSPKSVITKLIAIYNEIY